MKNIIKFTTMLFVAGLLVFSSCEKYLDVNVDPNNPTEVSDEDMEDLEKLIDKLEDDEDVQTVYTNLA